MNYIKKIEIENRIQIIDDSNIDYYEKGIFILFFHQKNK